MEENNEIKFLEKIVEFNNTKISVLLLNYYSKIKSIKEDMVNVLNLLDEVSENSKEKQVMRKKILDSYNELPRETKKVLNELLKILKEE